MNNPARAAHQHTREANWFRRLSGGGLRGQHVLEVGCGRGVGVEVLLDRLGAAHVTAFDLDPAQVDRARRRLRSRPAGTVSLGTGDATQIEARDHSVDAVVAFGTLHHVRRGAPPSRRSRASCVRAGGCCSRRCPARSWTPGRCAPSPSTPGWTASRQRSSSRSCSGTDCTAPPASTVTSAGWSSSAAPSSVRSARGEERPRNWESQRPCGACTLCPVRGRHADWEVPGARPSAGEHRDGARSRLPSVRHRMISRSRREAATSATWATAVAWPYRRGQALERER